MYAENIHEYAWKEMKVNWVSSDNKTTYYAYAYCGCVRGSRSTLVSFEKLHE